MTKIRSGLTALTLAGGMLMFAPAQAHAQKKERDLISREEIANSANKELDIYEVIRGLRPHFLEKPRGVRTIQGGGAKQAVVYIDGVRANELNDLKQISATTVDEVRYMEPAKAEGEYGAQAAGGAIVVDATSGGCCCCCARWATPPETTAV